MVRNCLIPDPKVRAKIRRKVRAFNAKCAKYSPALDGLLDQVFEHGPIEHERVSPEAMKHPEFTDFFDEFSIAGRRFYDLSGQGRYHMTGEHAAIDEKPWRPATQPQEPTDV